MKGYGWSKLYTGSQTHRCVTSHYASRVRTSVPLLSCNNSAWWQLFGRNSVCRERSKFDDRTSVSWNLDLLDTPWMHVFISDYMSVQSEYRNVIYSLYYIYFSQHSYIIKAYVKATCFDLKSHRQVKLRTMKFFTMWLCVFGIPDGSQCVLWFVPCI